MLNPNNNQTSESTPDSPLSSTESTTDRPFLSSAIQQGGNVEKTPVPNSKTPPNWNLSKHDYFTRPSGSRSFDKRLPLRSSPVSPSPASGSNRPGRKRPSAVDDEQQHNIKRLKEELDEALLTKSSIEIELNSQIVENDRLKEQIVALEAEVGNCVCDNEAPGTITQEEHESKLAANREELIVEWQRRLDEAAGTISKQELQSKLDALREELREEWQQKLDEAEEEYDTHLSKYVTGRQQEKIKADKSLNSMREANLKGYNIKIKELQNQHIQAKADLKKSVVKDLTEKHNAALVEQRKRMVDSAEITLVDMHTRWQRVFDRKVEAMEEHVKNYKETAIAKAITECEARCQSKFDEKIQQVEAAHETAMKEAVAFLRVECEARCQSECKEEIQRVKVDNEKLNRQLVQGNVTIESLRKDLSDFEDLSEKYGSRIDDLVARHKSELARAVEKNSAENITVRSNSLLEIDKACTEFTQKLSAKQVELDSIRVELATARAELAVVQEAAKVAANQQILQRFRAVPRETTIQQLTQSPELATARAELATARAELVAAQVELAAVREAAKVAEQQLLKRYGNCQRALVELGTKYNRLMDLRTGNNADRIAELEETIDAQLLQIRHLEDIAVQPHLEGTVIELEFQLQNNAVTIADLRGEIRRLQHNLFADQPLSPTPSTASSMPVARDPILLQVSRDASFYEKYMERTMTNAPNENILWNPASHGLVPYPEYQVTDPTDGGMLWNRGQTTSHNHLVAVVYLSFNRRLTLVSEEIRRSNVYLPIPSSVRGALPVGVQPLTKLAADAFTIQDWQRMLDAWPEFTRLSPGDQRDRVRINRAYQIYVNMIVM